MWRKKNVLVKIVDLGNGKLEVDLNGRPSLLAAVLAAKLADVLSASRLPGVTNEKLADDARKAILIALEGESNAGK